MRNKFDRQLEQLNNMLIEMGALIENAISSAIHALEEQDIKKARQTFALEEEVDQMERDIETLCLKLLLQQQPVARDLRLISAALKMITDMERISDQAADIAEIVLLLAGTPYIKKLEHIPQMADAAIKMVTDSIDAFVKKDLKLAEAVVGYDDVVDRLFDTVKNDLIALIRADSANGEQAIDLLMIAKYFERIGDHAENIAEWVVFSITGKREPETAE
ncbi:MAG: phosphate signaling complex protein PhoU [Clostridiales bacterium]|jgi:phosphate transport system protein|nr:phosphate signaling complex protein PhoU [Clostridiales bacterium]